jgi:hypothetical protein
MWYAENMLEIEPGFNAHLEKWNEEKNECTMTLTCFDDYPFPEYRRTKDDLQSYLVRKFGSMIIDSRHKSSKLRLEDSAQGIPLKHPSLLRDKKDYPSYSDNFKEEYDLELTKDELLEANGSFRTQYQRLKADKIKQIAGYESDKYHLRMGVWR